VFARSKYGKNKRKMYKHINVACWRQWGSKAVSQSASLPETTLRLFHGLCLYSCFSLFNLLSILINGLQSLHQNNNLSGFSYFFAYLPLTAPLLLSPSLFLCSLFIDQELERFSTTTLVFRSQPPLGLLPQFPGVNLLCVCSSLPATAGLVLSNPGQCETVPPGLV
jgi:hypothetical protein